MHKYRLHVDNQSIVSQNQKGVHAVRGGYWGENIAGC